MRQTIKFLLSAFLAAFACGTLARADETPIGYLQLPQTKKILIEKTGEDHIAVVDGKHGEVWSNARYAHEPRKFPVHVEPSLSSEKLTDLTTDGASMELMAETLPGPYVSNSQSDLREHLDGMKKIFVYEKRGEWVRVKFQNHLPWKGRFAWIPLGENTGGFISADGK